MIVPPLVVTLTLPLVPLTLVDESVNADHVDVAKLQTAILFAGVPPIEVPGNPAYNFVPSGLSFKTFVLPAPVPNGDHVDVVIFHTQELTYTFVLSRLTAKPSPK